MWPGGRGTVRVMTLSRNLARPLMASVFFVGPVNALRNSSTVAKKAEPVTGPIVRLAQRFGVPISHDPELMVKINAGVQLAGATALATGRCPRAAAGVLAVSMVPTTLAGHRFWDESDPVVRNQQRIQFAKNLAIIGGLVITALDTDGRPGRAWLTRQAAKRMSRRADHLAAMARLEAKVAALEAAGAGDTLTETLTTAGKAARVRAHGLGERFSEKAPEWAATAGAAGALAAHRSQHLGSRLAGTASTKTPEWTAAGRAAGSDALARSQDLGGQASDAVSAWSKQGRARARELRKELRHASKDARKELARQAKRARKNADAWAASAQREVAKAKAKVA